MEYAQKEIAVIEKTVAQIEQLNAGELCELQLLLIGGGAGDVVFA